MKTSVLFPVIAAVSICLAAGCKKGEDGVSASNKIGVSAKDLAQQTLIISPIHNPYEVQIGLLGASDYSNKKSIEEPLTHWTIQGVTVTTRNLVKFDLSGVPSTAKIISAHLCLSSDTIPQNGDLIHANFGPDNSFFVQQVATQWDPATITWFNQPDGLAANEVLVPSTTLPFLNVHIDVTNIVNVMLSNNSNYGFKLMLKQESPYPPNDYVSRIFCSSYYDTDLSRRPKLVIIYQP
ncbi:MAG TPA: DNRLRE domain-containing protein [Mucilaginibacter sp.]|nr:DNRLRE domain-containing protein [Mucilaginibacter sp.]